MAKQFSDAVRNAMGNSFETTVGASPRLHIRTGAAPVNCAAANAGSLLHDIPLPADWLLDADAGVKSLSGTWQGNAIAAGTAGHYRIMNASATECHEQGTITAAGGGGDMTVDNTNIALNQQLTVTAYTTTIGGA